MLLKRVSRMIYLPSELRNMQILPMWILTAFPLEFVYFTLFFDVYPCNVPDLFAERQLEKRSRPY